MWSQNDDFKHEHIGQFNGDEVAFTAGKKPGTVTVRVEGEHQSAQEYILPYGAQIGKLLKQIQLTERSDKESIQL